MPRIYGILYVYMAHHLYVVYHVCMVYHIDTVYQVYGIPGIWYAEASPRSIANVRTHLGTDHTDDRFSQFMISICQAEQIKSWSVWFVWSVWSSWCCRVRAAKSAWSRIGFLGWICTYTDPEQHLITAGEDLDDLLIDRDLSVWAVKCKNYPTLTSSNLCKQRRSSCEEVFNVMLQYVAPMCQQGNI